MTLTHPDLTPAAVTGDIPIFAVIPEYANGAQLEFGTVLLAPTWFGCLDAPEAILLGGCTAVDTSAYDGWYEGTTPRTKLRSAL